MAEPGTLAYRDRIEAAGGSLSAAGFAYLDHLIARWNLGFAIVAGGRCNLGTVSETTYRGELLDLFDDANNLIFDPASYAFVGEATHKIVGPSTTAASLFNSTACTVIFAGNSLTIGVVGDRILFEQGDGTAGTIRLKQGDGGRFWLEVVGADVEVVEIRGFLAAEPVLPFSWFFDYDPVDATIKVFDMLTGGPIATATGVPAPQAAPTTFGQVGDTSDAVRLFQVLRFDSPLLGLTKFVFLRDAWRLHRELIPTVTVFSGYYTRSDEDLGYWNSEFSILGADGDYMVLCMGTKDRDIDLWSLRPSGFFLPPEREAILGPLDPQDPELQLDGRYTLFGGKLLIFAETTNSARGLSFGSLGSPADLLFSDWENIVDSMISPLGSAPRGLLFYDGAPVRPRDFDDFSEMDYAAVAADPWRQNLRDWSARIRAGDFTLQNSVGKRLYLLDRYPTENDGWVDEGNDPAGLPNGKTQFFSGVISGSDPRQNSNFAGFARRTQLLDTVTEFFATGDTFMLTFRTVEKQVGDESPVVFEWTRDYVTALTYSVSVDNGKTWAPGAETIAVVADQGSAPPRYEIPYNADERVPGTIVYSITDPSGRNAHLPVRNMTGGSGGGSGTYTISVKVRDSADDTLVAGVKCQLWVIAGGNPLTNLSVAYDGGATATQNGESVLVSESGGSKTYRIPANHSVGGDVEFDATWDGTKWVVTGPDEAGTGSGNWDSGATTEDGNISLTNVGITSDPMSFDSAASSYSRDLTGASDVTGTDGLAELKADPGSYEVEAIPPRQYSAGAPAPVTVVDQNVLVDPLYVSQIPTPSPSDPSLCAITAVVYLNGVPVEGARVEAKLESRNQTVENILLSKSKLTGTTDAAGITVLELVRLDQFTNTPEDGELAGVYLIEAKQGAGIFFKRRIQVPNAESAYLEDIPEVTDP